MNVVEQMLDWKVDGIITDCAILSLQQMSKYH